jgi:hypothetical protein
MAVGGIFIHRSETSTVVPYTQAYVAIRTAMGKVEDPNLALHWTEAGVDAKKMLYDYPDVNPATTVYENASYFQSAVNNLQAYHGSFWKDNPIIVYIEHPHIDLMWVSSYIDYIYNELLPGVTGKRILLYCTPKKWNAIQIDNPDGENIKLGILNRAELFISAYGVNSFPPLNGVAPNQVHFWEYKIGFFEYRADGKFTHFADFATPPTSGSGTTNPPADPGTGGGGVITVSSEESLRLGCLDIATRIAIHNARGVVTLDPLTEWADKLLAYVKQK